MFHVLICEDVISCRAPKFCIKCNSYNFIVDSALIPLNKTFIIGLGMGY